MKNHISSNKSKLWVQVIKFVPFFPWKITNEHTWVSFRANLFPLSFLNTKWSKDIQKSKYERKEGDVHMKVHKGIWYEVEWKEIYWLSKWLWKRSHPKLYR